MSRGLSAAAELLVFVFSTSSCCIEMTVDKDDDLATCYDDCFSPSDRQMRTTMFVCQTESDASCGC